MERDRAVISSPVGKLGICATGKVLLSIDFLPDDAKLKEPRTALLRQAVKQLTAYFEGASFFFDLPLAEKGTPYQRAVWKALTSIPAGETCTYSELARRVGGSPRSVAGACRANPWPIVVPCHRVIAKDSLGGYGGAISGKALKIKRWLLAHEKRRAANFRTGCGVDP